MPYYRSPTLFLKKKIPPSYHPPVSPHLKLKKKNSTTRKFQNLNKKKITPLEPLLLKKKLQPPVPPLSKIKQLFTTTKQREGVTMQVFTDC